MRKILEKLYDIFHHHDCDITDNDGMSNVGICKKCGRKCLQDSYGQWFKLD